MNDGTAASLGATAPGLQQRRGLGLRAQLMLLMAGSMLAALAALALYMVREQTAIAREGIEQQTRAVARSIALGGENDLIIGRLDMVEDLLLRSAALPGVERAVVVDAEGRILAQVERSADGAALRPIYAPPSTRIDVPRGTEALLGPSAQGHGLTAWEPVLAGRLVAWVRVDHGIEALDAIRTGIWRGAVAACGLALLGSLLLLHGLLRGPLRTVQRARDFAAELGQAHGQHMASDVGAHEVRELVAALNRASTQLATQRASIEAQVSQLQDQEALLAARNQRLAMLFALCPDGIVSFDAHDVADYANPAFASLVGATPEQIVGRSLDWVDEQLRACGDEGSDAAPLARAFDAREAGAATRILLRLDRPHRVDLALQGVCSAQPAAATRLLYVRDITHETEVDRLKSEFLATAAHELRTPLVSIYGFAELLHARDYPAPKRAVMVETIHRQSKLMMAIVDELLDVARIEARRGADFDIQLVDLVELAAEAAGDFAAPAGRQPPQLRLPAAPLTVRADRGKLAQVLRNLLSNAYKYSPDGGDVVLTLHRDGEHGVLEVVDVGIGMTAEQLARVCERFYRADASGATPGVGLGMSIVKQLIELHGGQLHLQSQPGQGTTVTVLLPVRPA